MTPRRRPDELDEESLVSSWQARHCCVCAGRTRRLLAGTNFAIHLRCEKEEIASGRWARFVEGLR